MKSPQTIREQYLLDPFYNFLSDENARAVYRTLIKVLQAPTGFGKTHTLTNVFIPKIFETEQKKLIVYAVQNVENINTDNFTEAGQQNKYYFTTTVDEAFRWIKLGRNVVLAVTHAYMCNGAVKCKNHRKQLIDFAEHSAWFIEECHSWLGVTDQEWYEMVIGHATPDFGGTVYKLVKDLLKKTDLCFGITATPTKQHRGVVGDICFNIINDWCPVKDRLYLTKWSKVYKEFKGFDEVSYKTSRGRIEKKFQIDFNNCEANLRKYVREHHVANIKALENLKKYDDNISSKLSSIILCGGNNNTRLSVHIDEAREMLSDMLIKNGYNPSSQWIAVMTDSQKGFFNLYDDFIPCDEAGIISALNDSDEDCQFLLINNKGKAGIDVFNLTGICSMRIRNPKRTDCTELSRQIIGRLSRINSGHGNLLKDEYDYDLEKMCLNYCDDYKVDPKVFYETLKIANTFEFRYPSTPGGHWELSVTEFDEFYTASWDRVKDTVRATIFADDLCPKCPLLHKVNDREFDYATLDQFFGFPNRLAV
jgi:hypothetical protein